MNEPLVLDKHMNKITIDDQGVVIIRPRYPKNETYIRRAREAISSWQKQTGTKLQVLIVPHDWDVLAITDVLATVGSPSEPITESPSP